jgi:hypothetical protein
VLGIKTLERRRGFRWGFAGTGVLERLRKDGILFYILKNKIVYISDVREAFM